MTRVSVVILNFNGANFLLKFLPTVIRYSAEAQVIVIDNGSSDESVIVLKSQFPEVRLIGLQDNLGFTGGYNTGLKEIKSEYYVLLNSDVQVTPDWIGPIIDHLDQDPEIAACQPKILSQSAPDAFEYAGAGGGFIDVLGYPFCRGRLFQTLEQDLGQFDDVADVFWASGACLFIRSELFWALGGFDLRFFAHMEEIDLCWRLHRLGYRICYFGKSTVLHLGGGTLHQSNPRKTYLNFKNSLTMLYQNSGPRNLFFKVLGRIGLDLVASIKFLLMDSWGDFKAVLKADFEFISEFKRNKAIRKDLWHQANYRQIPEIYPRSIVLDYYLKGKRYFKDLNF